MGREGKRRHTRDNASGKLDPLGDRRYVSPHSSEEKLRRQSQEQLLQSQRLEALGTLVGGIAHDFNNILNVISGHVSLMERWRESPERFLKSFEAVRKATERGAGTARQLLTFARKVDVVMQPVKVEEVVNELVSFLKGTFPEKITLRVEIGPGIPAILADSNQIHQALFNLCLNSRDAIAKAGTISIVVKNIGQELVKGHSREAEAERYVQISVSDTGSGMDSETLSHIFEPFFTTKANGRGTGLGLSVVFGIMKAHNGLIDVESKTGQGTSFSLYFPVVPLTADIPPGKKTRTEIPKGHGELILVIEDEEPLRDFLKTVLEESGYGVILASDGIKGLQTYREEMDNINLVLLDMGLPKMSGNEVLEELVLLNPHVKVLSASGYIEPEVKSGAFDIGALDFLPKPYMIEDLLVKIHDVLQAGSVSRM
jgi:two-component system cell cycle sensor histidine kinase/response regulator CckA